MQKLKLTFLWCLLIGLLPVMASGSSPSDMAEIYRAKRSAEVAESSRLLPQQNRRGISATDGTVLYGAELWSDGWSSMESWAYPYGVYGFSSANIAPELQYSIISDAISAVMADGYFYVVSRIMSSDNYLTGITITKYNALTGQYIGVIDIFNPTFSKLPLLLTHDPKTGVTYALSYTEDNESHVLATIDLATGEMTTVGIVGKVSNEATFLTFSIDGKGTIYAISTDGNLYAINAKTGESDIVGPLGVTPIYLQSAVYDTDTDTLWWAASLDDNTGALFTVDTATGAATKVGDFPNNEEFIGLYLEPVKYDPAAPAQVVDLEFVPSTQGAVSGQVLFIVPETTVGGSELTGPLTVSILVDGKEVASVTGNPGEDMSVPVNVEPGFRTFTVTVSTGEFVGMAASTTAWIGEDNPAPVSSLNLSVIDGVANLSWIAAGTGEHGGYCPVEDVRYRIVRTDGTVAAEAWEGTTFTETLPEVYAVHAYTVTPYIPGKSEGRSMTSNSVKAGKYFEIPFSSNFNNDTEFYTYFTIKDNNNDGYTWQHYYTWNENVAVAQYPVCWLNPADDYLIFPGVKFSKDIVYSLTFDHLDYGNSTGSIKVLVGKGSEVSDLTRELVDYKNIFAQPTTNHEVRFSFPEDGVYYLAFYVYTQELGETALSIDNVNIDVVGAALAPAKPAISLAGISENDKDKVHVSVKAPSLTLSGENLDAISSLAVYRAGTAEAVHVFSNPAPGADLEWIDENPGSGVIVYNVVASNSHGTGESSQAEVFVGGIVPPYEATFDAGEDTSYFTIVDANGDNTTWHQDKAENAMVYSYNLFGSADDWLFSPKLYLSDKRVYQIVSTLRTNAAAESLAITYGPTPEIESQTILIDMPEFTRIEADDIESWLRVSESGCYNIGFHAYSPKNMYRIYLDNLKVIDVASVDAPDVMTAVSVTADPAGGLSATIKATAPTSTYNGDALESLDAVEIYRENETEPAAVITDVVPGKEISWIDTEAAQGMMTYRVCAVNGEGCGLKSKASAYVGHDRPAAVGDLEAKGDVTNANATLTWEAPVKGFDGGYVEQSALRYNIYAGPNEYTLQQIASNLTETTYLDNCNATGAQAIRAYIVEACSDAGAGARDTVFVSLGKLYDYPLVENFADYLTGEWSKIILTNYNGMWMVSDEYNGVTSADAGTRFLQFIKLTDDDAASVGILGTPKVSMEGSLQPYVTLSFYHDPAADPRAKMTIGYRVNDNSVVELAELVACDGEKGWKEYSWPIEAKTSDFVSVELHAVTYDMNTRMFVDNIRLDDRLDHNLTLDSFDAPIEIGLEGAIFKVKVQNKGQMDASGYSVSLVCDGTDVATLDNQSLSAGEVGTYEFAIEAPTAAEAGNKRVYKARIDYSLDQKPADNTSEEVECTVLTSPYPGITTLKGVSGNNAVNLSWETPSTSWNSPITDSFDDYDTYPPFAISDMGEWVLYDGDGQRTVGIRYGVSFANWYSPKAWQVWDPQLAGLLGDDVAAHEGYVCLMSMCSDGSIPGQDDYVTPANDDWLISEEVAGGSDVVFYLKQPVDSYGGNEAAEFLYSTTTQNPDQFTVIETIELNNKAVWNRYRIALPDDARYFAIRHHQSYFGLWLDDITYSPVRNASQLEIKGYNIYRDGVLIGVSETTSFTDSEPLDGVHSYAVAPRFDTGEGRLSNVVEVDASQVGVANVGADADVEISTIPGAIGVKSAAETTVAIYTPDGRLVVSQSVDGEESFRLTPGVYIVKAAATVKKVLVK